MAFAAPERPRPPMGLPARRLLLPMREALPEEIPYEQQLEMHCFREAQREVECWFLPGTVYHWQPFVPRDLPRLWEVRR